MRRQTTIWNNAGILLIEPIGTNFSEILIEIHTFSFMEMHLKMSSGKWRSFCLGPNVIYERSRVSKSDPHSSRTTSVQILITFCVGPCYNEIQHQHAIAKNNPYKNYGTKIFRMIISNKKNDIEFLASWHADAHTTWLLKLSPRRRFWKLQRLCGTIRDDLNRCCWHVAIMYTTRPEPLITQRVFIDKAVECCSQGVDNRFV